MRIQITAEANTSGVMVALVPPKAVSQQIMDAADATEPLDEQHLTLGYMGDTDEVDHEVLLDTCESWAQAWDLPLTGKPNGFAVFQNEQDTLVAIWNISNLAAARTSLCEVLDNFNVGPKRNYDFVPHQSMRYSDDPITEIPRMPEIEESTFEGIVVAYGGEWVLFPFGGGDPEPGRVAKIAAKPHLFYPSLYGGKYHEANSVSETARCRGIELDMTAEPIHVHEDQERVHPIVCQRCMAKWGRTASKDDPCTACGGTGEQGTGHECYL